MARPIVDFTWSPRQEAEPIVLNSNTYPYETQDDATPRASDTRYISWSTTIETPITFTSTVTLPSGLLAVEYRWNLGDGTISYGPTVTHTYQVANKQLAASLTVVDTLGQSTSRSQIIGLVFADMGSSGILSS